MDQFRLFPRYLGSLLLRLAAAVLLGTLLLSLVCMLPTGPMVQNLQISAAGFEKEGTYPSLFPWCTSQLDNYTDSLILQISAFDSGESPVIQAMSGARGSVTGAKLPTDDLVAHYGHGIPFDFTDPYYQYWHGYQVIIRPLLSLLDYSGIRILNGAAQTVLLLFLCILLHRNSLGRYILPLIASLLMLMPLATAMSLQFSSCYYILILGSIFLLRKKDSLDRIDGLLFLYIGIVTAYFDFLTYPITTLGIPAVIYFAARDCHDIRNTFCRGVKICFSWGVGYLGMWSGKWLIGSLILRTNILSVASEKIVERSSADEGFLHTLRAALGVNLRSFLHTPAALAVFLLAGILLVFLAVKLRKEETVFPRVLSALFPFVILALLPIAWYVISSQHALIHHWFTSKSLFLSVFAGLAALVKASEPAE